MGNFGRGRSDGDGTARATADQGRPKDALGQALAQRMSEQTKVWRDELVNTTRANRLLYYRPTKASTLEFVSPPPQALLDRLVGEGEVRFFMPEIDEQGATLNKSEGGRSGGG
jgi:hypothetical protein